jgi:hypothetical protein
VVELNLWFRLAAELHTDLITVSSNFLPAQEIPGNMIVI